MTSEELNHKVVWECLKPGGFYEILVIRGHTVQDAGHWYKNLIGSTTGTARQKLRNDGWEINVHTFNSEGIKIPCQ